MNISKLKKNQAANIVYKQWRAWCYKLNKYEQNKQWCKYESECNKYRHCSYTCPLAAINKNET